MRPSVTIGIPVYNSVDILGQTLDSVLKQSVDDWSVIISDNGSTDGTMELAQSYAERDPRITAHQQPENRGQAYNYRFVFHQSDSPYFMWLSADDLLAPTYLELTRAALEADPDLIGVYGSAVEINGEGVELEPYIDGRHPERRNSPDAAVRFGESLLEVPALSFYSLFRSSVLEQTPLFGSYVGADRILMAELGLRGRVLKLDDMIFYRRAHEKQFSWGANSHKARYRVIAGGDPGPFVGAGRYVELMKAIRRVDLTPSERADVMKVVFGPYLKRAGKDEVSMVLRSTLPNLLGRVGIEFDYYDFLRRRKQKGRMAEADKEQQ
ncbi:MAG: glycosyltransferase family 2 protein [Actinomycetota bacterium]